MNYEYYPQEYLVGKRRVLKAFGNFLKEHIDESLLARAYHQILTEEHTQKCTVPDYTEAELCLAGLTEETEDLKRRIDTLTSLPF